MVSSTRCHISICIIISYRIYKWGCGPRGANDLWKHKGQILHIPYHNSDLGLDFLSGLRASLGGLSTIQGGLRVICGGLRASLGGLRTILVGLRAILDCLRVILGGLRGILGGLRASLAGLKTSLIAQEWEYRGRLIRETRDWTCKICP